MPEVSPAIRQRSSRKKAAPTLMRFLRSWESGGYLLADRPTSADTAAFGLVAPMVYGRMETPVAIMRALCRT